MTLIQQSVTRPRMRHRLKLASGMAALLLAAVPVAARAQTDPDLTSKLLIAILVKKGVLSQADANSILQEAQQAASAAQASEAAARPASPAPIVAAPGAPVSTVEVTSTEAPDGTVHVTYIPQIVRDQIATSVKQQMVAEQQAQGYSGNAEVPSWVNRIHFYGDFRMRYEADLFPPGNDPDLPNFNAINTGAPYDVSSSNLEFEPRIDSTENRNRFEIRARFGADFDLGDDFSIGIRLASGQNDSPVSENQTLGYANNGQGGDFSKYAIWIDRAYIAYTPKLDPDLDLTFKAGRFDNPFFSTNLIWADDLAFDGFMGTGSYAFDNGLTPFLTAGVFPVENTGLNFASNTSATEFASTNKFLYAAQTGSAVTFNDDYAAKFGIAGYFYTNVAGKLSSPCYVYSASDVCDTDQYRPSFAQNGNTYMELRDIVPTTGPGGNNDGTTNQYQYFGLASGFNELALTGEFDVNNFDPADIWLDGEYVHNFAFNQAAIAVKAVNNRGATSTANPTGTYDGGNNGFYFNANVGQKVLAARWDWNAMVGYKYIQSDSVVDAFNDSDFGLGGTNLQGYIVGGNLALSPKVWIRLRYLSADSIIGPTYKADVFQFDLNGKF
jgi:hypothetical protein